MSAEHEGARTPLRELAEEAHALSHKYFSRGDSEPGDDLDDIANKLDAIAEGPGEAERLRILKEVKVEYDRNVNEDEGSAPFENWLDNQIDLAGAQVAPATPAPVPLIISPFCYHGAHLRCDTDKRCQCECHYFLSG